MVIVFDVDGTLLDTYQVVRQTYIDIITAHLPHVSWDEDLLKTFFGPPLKDTFYQLVQDEAKAIDLVQKYRSRTKVNNPLHLKVFPDAIKLVTTLHQEGFQLGILSNKIKDAILEGFYLVGMPQVFDYILGYEDLTYPKPNPEGLEKMRAHFNDEVIMVGDSIYDIETAKRAQALSIGVTWGMTQASVLQEAGATWVVNTMEELHQLLRSHRS